MSNNENSGYGEFRRGWPIVLAAFLGVGLGLSPLPFYTIGLLAPELAREFGWGIGQVIFGITVMTLATLMARYFGMRSYTQVYALLYCCFAVGAGFGPAVFGWSFDKTGSYTAVLTTAGIALMLSACALLAPGRYRSFETK